MKTETETEKKYEAPIIEILEVEVERGYAASPPDDEGIGAADS